MLSSLSPRAPLGYNGGSHQPDRCCVSRSRLRFLQRPFEDVDLGAIAGGGDGALPHVQRLLSLLLLATVEMADADARDAVLQRLMGLPEPAQDALMSLIEGLMPEVQGAAAQGEGGETDGAASVAEAVEAGAPAGAADPSASGPLLSPRPSRGLAFARTPLGASGLSLSGRRGAAGDLRGILSTARRARAAAAGGCSPGGGSGGTGFTPAQLRALKSPLGAFAARCMEAAAPVPRLAAAAAEAAAAEGGWTDRARTGGTGSGAAVSSAINAAGGVSGPPSPSSGPSLPSAHGSSVRPSSALSASAAGASGDLAAHNRLLQEEIVSQTDDQGAAGGCCTCVLD